ncbi:MAG: hypothetical protein WBQ60_03115 [Asticcacaulis sp.]
MMKSAILLAGAALLAVSAFTAPAFAEGSFSNPSMQTCSIAQQEKIGKQIADAAADKVRDKAPAQSKRLIKVESCTVKDGIASTYFTYNYMANDMAYAVEGKASVDAAGAVELAEVNRPGVVFASIETNYIE